jgi:MFS family permease
MRAFLIVWFGQVISMLGSAMTTFALTIWAYELTGSATALALVSFFSFGPAILFSPIAGALVDRWNRKLVMMLSDLGAGVSTIAILILYSTGNLQIWHLYIAGAISGIFATFQWPAYSAAISTMLPKDQYARASGLLGLADSASNVFAPIFATALLVIIGISGVMIIDIVTFLFAVGTLLIIFIPQPEISSEGTQAKGNLFKESLYGFRYILQRPSLLALQLTFFFINLTGAFAYALVAPMLLARTGNNEAVLATVQSVGAIGGIVGGLLLSVWGGPKRRIHGILLGMIGASLLGHFLMGVGQVVVIWAIASFSRALFLPILNGSNQAIWQAKVAPDVQGRVFSARRMIAQVTGPVSILLAGPLADRVFEPAMRSGGSLAPIFGGLVGTGAGAGMALMFVIAGVASLAVGLVGYALPIIRNAEDLLPDHTVLAPSPPIPAAESLMPSEPQELQALIPQSPQPSLAHELPLVDAWLPDDETAASPATLAAQAVALSQKQAADRLVYQTTATIADTWLPDDETAASPATLAAQSVTLSQEKYAEALLPRLADGGLISQQIVRELRATKQNIASVLLDHLHSDDPLIRAGCASILGAYHSEPVIDALVELLQDQDVRARLNAARSLGEIGDKAAVPALLRAIDDRSDLVGRAAVLSLGEIKDERVLDVLLQRLPIEENALMKQGIISTLGQLGCSEAAQPLLNVFLQPRESEKMRDSAAMALTLLGKPGKQALQTALVDGDDFAQHFAKTYLRLQV